jgi:hypothetical protein
MIAYEAYFDDEPAVGGEDGDRFATLGLLLAEYEEQGPSLRRSSKKSHVSLRS